MGEGDRSPTRSSCISPPGVSPKHGEGKSFRRAPGFAEGVMVMMRKIDPEKGPARATRRLSPAAGFTLVEVLISMLVTLIVMSAVFGLLSRGQSTFQREPEIADMQQTARAALDMVPRDALQAGAGLPPEFPSFTPPAVGAAGGGGGGHPGGAGAGG